MPYLSRDKLEETARLYREIGTYHGTAKRLGLDYSTVRSRIIRCRREGIDCEPQVFEPDYEPPPPDPEQRPTLRVRYEPDDMGKHHVLAIGDAHDSPRLEDKSRFTWMGRLAADVRPDWIIQIGDFFTLDSLCRYDANDSLRGRAKPSFIEDMASGKQALEAFDAGLGQYGCQKHVTLGNHEDRIWSFTDRTPEIRGMMVLELDRLLHAHDWTYSPYGQPYFVGGVAFIHTPMTIMGKPIGGELSANTVTLRATHDWVYGHDHRANAQRRPKIGVNNFVNAIDLGCALPQDYIEPYATVATTGWWYGCWELFIERGRVQSYKQHAMLELAKTYG